MESNKQEIDAGNLVKGIYFIQIKNNRQLTTKKII
ncbi:T9SS type A sorting domain-containing protein [Seonamhaeicola sp. MEBiC1930]